MNFLNFSISLVSTIRGTNAVAIPGVFPSPARLNACNQFIMLVHKVMPSYHGDETLLLSQLIVSVRVVIIIAIIWHATGTTCISIQLA